jgi:hypothetical protein
MQDAKIFQSVISPKGDKNLKLNQCPLLGYREKVMAV